MKRNNIIIASAISAIPLVVWGVKAVIKKDPLQKIKDALMKQDLYMKEDMQKAGTNSIEEVKIIPSKKEVPKNIKNAKTIIKDKIVGKTAEGHSIYEGAKGGRYTKGSNGRKFYVKK